MVSRKRSAIWREITTRWTEISDRAGLGYTPKLPKNGRLLGSSVKVAKGPRHYVVRVVYLAPATEAFHVTGDRRTLCGSASDGCAALCLGHSTGHLQWSHARNARAWKTALLLGDRALWRELLDAEVALHRAACDRAGKVAVVRVDGSSDTGEGRRAALRNPAVQFYDYTKRLGAALGSRPANYALTFSWSGENAAACERALAAGCNVAVPFDTPKGRALPAAFLGSPVIDGDADDLRFLDPTGPRGYVVGLRFKAGSDRQGGIDRSEGFVVLTEALDLAA